MPLKRQGSIKEKKRRNLLNIADFYILKYIHNDSEKIKNYLKIKS
jgi:hypothetical protein